jgi:hypothetical protein
MRTLDIRLMVINLVPKVVDQLAPTLRRSDSAAVAHNRLMGQSLTMYEQGL